MEVIRVCLVTLLRYRHYGSVFGILLGGLLLDLFKKNKDFPLNLAVKVRW